MIRAGMTKAAQSMNKMMVRGLSTYLVNENIPVPMARKRFERVNRFAPVPTEVSFQQEMIGGVPVEVVLPEQVHEERSLLYFHGGAFCVGTPKTHRELTAWLAKTLQAKVVVPDYRLAPEHPYPAAPDDCFAVYQAMLEQGHNPEKLLVGGDSAGGNLALVLMLRL
ncbi:MAG: alpha/beta hydrolase, partial [Pseudomonadales bacterium]|nr:alpha/beta hydrolase [Pseudomonadales bacterium]